MLTPYRSATSVTGTPASTSSTARYLCSATLNSHGMSRSVKHQTEPLCKASSGTAHSSAPGACDNFLYGFKGAPSARHAYGRNRAARTGASKRGRAKRPG